MTYINVFSVFSVFRLFQVSYSVFFKTRFFF